MLAAVLPGCGQVQSIDADFAGLRGQPIASAEAKLGPPQRREGSVSVWTDSVRDDTPILRDQVIFDNGRATTVQVMERPDIPPLRTCTLTVQTDGTGTIVSIDRNGTSAACAAMARKVAGQVFP